MKPLYHEKKNKGNAFFFFFVFRGVAGDLYILLHIDEKHGIRRDGLNLYSTISVDYTEAILGTVVKVILFAVVFQHEVN